MRTSTKCTLIFALFAFAACGLNADQKKAAEDALSELRKLDAATDVGINKLEYSRMLISAQAATKRADELLPDGELKNGIRTTQEKYADANKLWNLMGNDSFVLTCIGTPVKQEKDETLQKLAELMCNEDSRVLMEKYKIPLRDTKSGEITTNPNGAIIKKEGISLIWQSAKEELDRTSKLLAK